MISSIAIISAGFASGNYKLFYKGRLLAGTLTTGFYGIVNDGDILNLTELRPDTPPAPPPPVVNTYSIIIKSKATSSSCASFNRRAKASYVAATKQYLPSSFQSDIAVSNQCEITKVEDKDGFVKTLVYVKTTVGVPPQLVRMVRVAIAQLTAAANSGELYKTTVHELKMRKMRTKVRPHAKPIAVCYGLNGKCL
jgi:hypothetical protein